MTDAGEKLAYRIAEHYADWLDRSGSASVVKDFTAFALRAELERAAGIADDCHCDRQGDCFCELIAAAIRKLKE